MFKPYEYDFWQSFGLTGLLLAGFFLVLYGVLHAVYLGAPTESVYERLAKTGRFIAGILIFVFLFMAVMGLVGWLWAGGIA